MSIIRLEDIYLDMEVTNKESLFNLIAKILLEKQLVIATKQAIIDLFVQREEEVTTGIGNHVAIPHIKSDIVQEARMLFMRLRNKIDYLSLDNQKVDLIFIIVMPKDAHHKHLQTLKAVSLMLLDSSTYGVLNHAVNQEDIQKYINNFEGKTI